MSKIEANTIDSVSGTSTLTLGSSNASTIALGSGDVQSNFLHPAFWVIKNASQSIAGDTAVQLTYETEILDSDGAFASSTFTPQKAGYYLIYAQARFNSNDDADQWKMMFYKNGAELAIGSTVTRTQQTAQVSGLVQFNGSSDNLKFYVYHNLSGSNIDVQDQNQYTYAFGFKLIGL